ncbi:hypothetical protein T492DRAFT_870776 [Pavlovales sp. CCMP2436]|nr:hypothetical protein T492DRAFT_870776 [Pavlovales sp. CCMP2436]
MQRANQLLSRSLRACDALGVRRALARGADAVGRGEGESALWWLALLVDDKRLELSHLLLAARGGSCERTVADVLQAIGSAQLSEAHVQFVLLHARVVLEDAPALLRGAVISNRVHVFEAILLARGASDDELLNGLLPYCFERISTRAYFATRLHQLGARLSDACVYRVGVMG